MSVKCTEFAAVSIILCVKSSGTGSGHAVMPGACQLLPLPCSGNSGPTPFEPLQQSVEKDRLEFGVALLEGPSHGHGFNEVSSEYNIPESCVDSQIVFH